MIINWKGEDTVVQKDESLSQLNDHGKSSSRYVTTVMIWVDGGVIQYRFF